MIIKTGPRMTLFLVGLFNLFLTISTLFVLEKIFPESAATGFDLIFTGILLFIFYLACLSLTYVYILQKSQNNSGSEDHIPEVSYYSGILTEEFGLPENFVLEYSFALKYPDISLSIDGAYIEIDFGNGHVTIGEIYSQVFNYDGEDFKCRLSDGDDIILENT